MPNSSDKEGGSHVAITKTHCGLTKREIAAFSVSPMVVLLAPISLFISYNLVTDPLERVVYDLKPVLLVTGLFYGGTIVFGLPTYFLLIRCKVTSFWLAPILGASIGIITQWVFLYTSVSILAGGFIDVAIDSPVLFFEIPGGCGLIVGVVLWLIARPDRRLSRSE